MTVRRRRRLMSTSLTAGKAAVPAVVGGQGVWFELADGRRVIDASNTAAPLGHGHPELRDAARRAVDAPVVNEGWGWADRERAAEDLVRIAFGDAEWVGAVRFFTSASEANDAALSLCQALTGRAGLATRERAYHGGAGLAREVTVQPHWHGGLASTSGGTLAPPRLATVHVLPAPAGSQETANSDSDSGDTAADLGEDERMMLADSAAVILDYSQGGVYHSASYQDRVAELAREVGTLWIADETVTGFGRVGGWFQFQHADSRPDIVTLGKCLTAGAAPGGAVVVSRDLLDRLSGNSWQTYSTYRAHPLQVAAVRAHLAISARDRLTERALQMNDVMLSRLSKLARVHPSIARIDGRGLHWTVELHGPDWRQWRGEEPEPLASRVAARALAAGALFATSGEQTSLFVAPPLVITAEELDALFAALDEGLTVADAELEHSSDRSRTSEVER